MSEALPHPQPVGAFAPPAGLLLVPAGGDEVEAARAALLAGRRPETWPPELVVHERVHAGDTAGALRALDEGDLLAPEVTSSPSIARYHRWVLDPDGDDPAQVRAALPESVAALVDVVAHMLDRGEQPDPEALPPATAPEVRALVRAARAAASLEAAARGGHLAEGAPGDGQAHTDAQAELRRAAAEAPPGSAAAALLLGEAGALVRDLGDTEGALSMLSEASQTLAGSDLCDERAELLLHAGTLDQEAAAMPGATETELRSRLTRAMQRYYAGLQLVTEDGSPVLWGSLNLNLAAAQLAVPMTSASDQLRVGVATQALRACRRVFTADAQPAEWSTATLNLANALVYAPTTHRADNLAEATELYEEVLASGTRDADPVGRARVLANLGNVLAHRGALDEAQAALVEARYVFEEHLDHDSVATVRGVLDEIARTRVRDPDPDDLAHRAEQMSRMPEPAGPRTSGMGVTIDVTPPPRPVVTVVDPASRPTDGGSA